jgi:hypothetical protein
MKNPLFNMKSVIKGIYKANVGAGAGSGARVRAGAGAGAEKLSAPQHWMQTCHNLLGTQYYRRAL